MFIWIVFIGIAVISYLVQSSLQSKFEKYSQIPLSNGMTGREVAEKMLRDNGIYDVRVVSTGGMLTDHYNPANKTVNLSEGVFNTCSVAAAAVAAHECGHAVQHARAYAPLQMRSALVPVVQFSSSIMSWILLAGILMIKPGTGLVEQRRCDEFLQSQSGKGCAQVGCLYICGSGTGFTGNADLLHHDLYQSPRVSGKSGCLHGKGVPDFWCFCAIIPVKIRIFATKF